MNLILFLSKAILIAGLLFGYYFLFLRNKKFHQYNRFFLLAIPLISILLPLMNIPLAGFHFQQQNTAIKLLKVVGDASWEQEVVVTPHHSVWQSFITWQNTAWAAFIIILLMLAVRFAKNILHIKKIETKYPGNLVNGIRFYQTEEPGTPFSFFKNIFWNNRIEISTEKGQQIFRHEMYHVLQKHSADIIYMELATIVCWFNPFFHLIKKEIKTVHEFLADQYATSETNRHDYAQLLVLSAASNSQLLLPNSFFNYQIKRRINMLIQLKRSKYNYIRRLMALPLLFFLFCAFALKIKNAQKNENLSGHKSITLVIDAGHGGAYNGTIGSNGIQEKDINLSIAKRIKQLGKEYNINVIMTRDKDETVGNAGTLKDDLQNRVNIATKNKADVFISLHVDADIQPSSDKSGFEVFISKNTDGNNFMKSKMLASAIIESLKSTYKIDEQLRQRNRGIVVLDKNSVPAIMVECGYINNQKDLSFISDPLNQEKIARDILEGVVKYNSGIIQSPDLKKDTISAASLNKIDPNDIKSVNVSKKTVLVNLKNGDSLIADKEEVRKYYQEHPLKLNGYSIKANVKTQNADTVAEFTSISKNNFSEDFNTDFKSDTTYPKIFTKVEVEADYPGGDKAWVDYLIKNLKYPEDAVSMEIQGTVIVKFIVDMDGNLSDIKAIKSPSDVLSKVSCDIIRNSGKWIPAKQNGKIVNSYKKQPIVFKLQPPSSKPDN